MASIKKTLSNMELVAFCEQLSFILNSGISLQEGLILMGDEQEDKAGSHIAGSLLEDIEMGSSFTYALRKAEIFPNYMVNMIEIGETSGRLQEVLNSLTSYYERNENISRSIKNAIIYPCVIIAMMFGVIFIIITEILPVFENVFLQLGSEMSGFVKGLMQISEFSSQYSIWFIIGICLIVAAVIVMKSTKWGKSALESLYEKLFSKTLKSISAGRFAGAMSLMLSSGMDVDESLNMSMELIQSNTARAKIAKMKKYIEEDEGFAQAIVKAQIFSEIYGKMVTIGFKTGTLDQVMEKIANNYDEESSRRINTLVAIIEPTLVVILSLIVGMIILSVMLPLMGVMSAIG